MIELQAPLIMRFCRSWKGSTRSIVIGFNGWCTKYLSVRHFLLFEFAS